MPVTQGLDQGFHNHSVRGIEIWVAVAGGVGRFTSPARVILPVHEISVLVSDIVILLITRLQWGEFCEN